ncbi:MAG: hypothetical protein AB7K71_31830 [Polyangiaceae bacterium]
MDLHFATWIVEAALELGDCPVAARPGGLPDTAADFVCEDAAAVPIYAAVAVPNEALARLERERELQGFTWTRMESGEFELGDVHAASWAKAGFFILDVVGSGWHKRMRLVQVDPTTRQFRAVTEWPYLGLFGTQYLTADQDGELLMASSSRLFRSHAIARVAVSSGEPELQGLLLGKGELADRPLVDSRSYTVVTQDRQGRLTPQRKAQLFSARGTWQDLGRCF